MRCVVMATMAFGASSVFAADLPQKVKPVMVWTGFDTKQSKETFARCSTQKDWQASWNAHCGRDKEGFLDNPACPEVDFDSFMVIAIFHNSSRLSIAEVVEEAECVRVRYKPWGGQAFFAPGDDGKFKIIDFGRGEIDPEKTRTLSFAFVVLPRSTKATILEEDVQPILGEQPVWKERVKFSGLAEK